MAEYETQHAGTDQRLAATLGMRPGGVMVDHEHFSPREALRNPVYADWLIPLGLKHTAAMVARSESGALDIISFMRPRDAKSYSAADKCFIERLVPDISRAARLRARMLDLSQRAVLGLAALDSLRQGVAVVDAHCRIHHTNTAMERLLAAPGALCATQGRLGCLDGAAQTRLRHLATAACAPPGRAGALALPPHDEALARLVVTVLPLQAHHTWAAARQVPMALVVAAAAGLPSGLDPALVGEVLGLSPTEARLALLLASGRTVKDFAAIQGCTLNTARTHLANLLGKTGCRRQVDLVQLLHALQGA
jgi:DNA-binding CsgD family transcriptional regulator